jgi:hypothetical protein
MTDTVTHNGVQYRIVPDDDDPVETLADVQARFRAIGVRPSPPGDWFRDPKKKQAKQESDNEL